MPILVASLLGALIQGAGTLVGRVLISLGIGYVSFTGIEALVNSVKADVFQAIGSQGAVVVQLAGVLQIGTCVNIMTSALVVKLTLSGLTSGAITKMVTK